MRESEERYRQLVELCPDGILVHSNGSLLFANAALAEILRAGSPADLIGVPLMEIVHPECRRMVQDRIDQLNAGALSLPWTEQKLVRRDGSVVEVEAAARPLTLQGERAVQVMVRDITQRKAADSERDQHFQEMETARARLELLSHRLVEVQEAERRHIARELHDQVGQELTALKLNLDRCAALNGVEEPLQEARSRVNHLIKLVRQMSLDLRPIMLDDLGLLPALHWHFDRVFAVSGISVELKHNGLSERRFPTKIETAVYRIIQEALTNVVRHSRATSVTVRLWRSNKSLSVQIEDSGVGFDLESALSSGMSSGLSGMRERAALLGGGLTIESEPGAGTQLTAEFPLNHEP